MLLAVRLPNVIAALAIFYSLLGVSLFVPIVGGLYVPPRRHARGAGVGRRRHRRRCSYLNQQPWAMRSIWFNPSLAGLVAAALAFFVVAAVRRPAAHAG